MARARLAALTCMWLARLPGQAPAPAPTITELQALLEKSNGTDTKGKAAADRELDRFLATAADWSDDRFDADRAKAFIRLVSIRVNAGLLAGDGPEVRQAHRLASRDRLDNQRTMLAATLYGSLHQQARLNEVADAGLQELQWLCENSKHPYAIAEATLAAVVIDACRRTDAWAGIDSVVKLLPVIEQRPRGKDARPGAAVDVLVAQCRFLHALTFGQPERAARCLDAEEARIDAVGNLFLAPRLKLGLRRDSLALALANEDFAQAEDIAGAALQEAGRSELPEAIRRAYAERFQTGLANARFMQGKLEQDDPDVTAKASREARLDQRVQRAWHAYAQHDKTGFLGLANVSEADLADCQDGVLIGEIAGLQLQASLAFKPETEAGWVTWTKTLQKIRGRLQRVFEDKLTSVAALPSNFGGIGMFHFQETQQLLADLVDAELALQPGDAGVQAAMAIVLRAQAQGSLTRSLAASRATAKDGQPAAVTLEAVQMSLPANAVALIFLPSRYRSTLLAVSQTELLNLSLPSRTEFDELAWQVTARLPQTSADPDPSQLEDLKRLRALLLPDDVLQRIDHYEHWIVVSTGTLTNLPFEALPLDKDTLVGERHAVSNVSSLPLRALLAPKAPPPAARLRLLMVANLAPAAVGRPEFGLEGIRPSTVGDRLAPLLAPFADPVKLADGEATEGALRAQSLRDYDVVHILAHGTRDTLGESGWGIAIGGSAGPDRLEDGLLWPQDALAMPANGLLILSACRVARAPRRIGEDHGANLGGAFLYAGASAVVQSRSAIRLDEICGLMQHFHTHLAKGEPWAEALRAARAAVRGGGARLRAAQVQLSGWSQ